MADTETQEILDKQSPTIATAKKPKKKKSVAATLAKASRQAKKAKAKAKKAVKKKPAQKKAKAKKPAKKAAKAPAKKAEPARTKRIDVRLTVAERTKLVARAKRLKRTITSVVLELIQKCK